MLATKESSYMRNIVLKNKELGLKNVGSYTQQCEGRDETHVAEAFFRMLLNTN